MNQDGTQNDQSWNGFYGTFPNWTILDIKQLYEDGGDCFQYRTDINQFWQPYVCGSEIVLENIGDYVQFRINPVASKLLQSDMMFTFGSTSAIGIGTFNISTGVCDLAGHLGSLLLPYDVIQSYDENWYNTDFLSVFFGLFGNCNIEDASNLILPAFIADQMYMGCFSGCTKLKYPPKSLNVIDCGICCYQEMFYECTSLLQTPIMPATVLNDACYCMMYYGCTSLTIGPELPAATRSDGSEPLAEYQYMFQRMLEFKFY